MKQSITRITTGFIILAIGIGALLGAVNLIPFWSWFGQFWPLLVILAGIFVLIGDFRHNFIWGFAVLIVGVLLQLKQLAVIEFSFFSLLVPIILIAAGLSILLHVQNRAKVATDTSDADNVSVIFSGSETRNSSKNYQGGRVTSIFGGASLDLRDAKLSSTATLDLFVLLGGVEIRVPRDWKVVSKVAPIAGGVENKSEGSDAAKNGPTLILTGTVALGGVEVKA